MTAFRISTLSCAMIIAVLASGAARAQEPSAGYIRSTHGAWSLVCDMPPGASREQCLLTQDVAAPSRPDIILSVLVLKTADNKAQLLRLIVPLGMLVQPGIGLTIDDKSIGHLDFVRCLQGGCYAEVLLEQSLIDTLKSAKAAVFNVFQTPEESIQIPIDVNGFGEGLTALP